MASTGVVAAKRIAVTVHLLEDMYFVLVHSSDIHCVMVAYKLEQDSQWIAFHKVADSVTANAVSWSAKRHALRLVN